ncbi:hypothetical protein [Oceanirhabdus sp. W0125-5]|uniref:hypothetical protein n=1 Tax=Oceanirhabdus sp. W0125-5 TaxID=2999116 RepID=UPI0022F316DD|nr:hypothetical protein [Oceanirhabdus sp. W0125-5]WBW95976.1 hypothetical protein OW730_20120 [Oceanirhabdus sp. W0125-5]
MKRKKSREYWTLIILIPVFLILVFFFGKVSGEGGIRYSAFNRGRSGSSVFYKTLKALDMDVLYTIEDIETNTSSNQLVFYDVQKMQYYPVLDEGFYKRFIEEKLVFTLAAEDIDMYVEEFESKNHISWDEEETFEIDDKTKAYRFKKGKGEIIFIEARALLNMFLLENKDGAYWLYERINKNDQGISFNEKGLMGVGAERNLWTDLPANIKIICIQILLVLIAYMILKGRRFGKGVPYVEELERVENEYVISCAGIFQKNKNWDIVYEGYYRNFIQNALGYFGKGREGNLEGIFDLWHMKGIEGEEKVKKLINLNKEIRNFTNKDIKKNKKKYVEAINILEKLNFIIDRRREEVWKR